MVQYDPLSMLSLCLLSLSQLLSSLFLLMFFFSDMMLDFMTLFFSFLCSCRVFVSFIGCVPIPRIRGLAYAQVHFPPSLYASCYPALQVALANRPLAFDSPDSSIGAFTLKYRCCMYIVSISQSFILAT